MSANSRRVFHTLDAIRGVAAGAIVVRHCPALFGAITFPNSQLAVDLFFALSGFVIAHAYEERLSGEMKLGRFMLVRVIRLYPLYAMGTMLGIVGGIAALVLHRSDAPVPASSFLSTAALAALMLPAWPSTMATFLFPLNPPAWSLTFELVGNGVYAALLRRGLGGTRALFGIVVVSAAILIGSALWLGGIGSGFNWGTSWGAIPRLAYSFTMGIVLHRIPRRYWPKFRLPAWLIPASIIPLFLINPPGTWGIAFQLLCVLLVFPLLVLVGAATEPPEKQVPIFRTLGLTSYGVYALHKPIANLVAGLMSMLKVPLSSVTPWSGVGFLAMLFAGVVVADRIFDAPIRAWLAKKLVGHSKPTRAEAFGHVRNSLEGPSAIE